MSARETNNMIDERQHDIVVRKETFPHSSIARALYKGYVRTPQKRVAVDGTQSLTYADAYRRANVLAWYLRRECGIVAGSTVALSSPNDIYVPVVMAAVQLCGANLVQLPPGLRDFELKRNVGLVPPDLLIVSSEKTRSALVGMGSRKPMLMIGGFQGEVPSIREVSSPVMLGAKWEFPSEQNETEIVLYSSGSTGAPKAIVNWARSFAFTGKSLRRAFSIKPDDVMYIPVPFAHVFGIVGLYAALLSGATVVTSAKYRPETALALMSNSRVTIHFGVATMFLRELREIKGSEWDLSSLRAGLVAGAGCPASVLYEFQDRFGCRISQSYGMTETAATLTQTPLDLPVEVRAKTVGFPIDGVEISLDDKTGEILCKTPALMKGIVGEDQVCRCELDEGGWLRTGDVGRFDEDGMLSIVGRIKDIVIRGGINIFPAEVEALYEQCPHIIDSCMVGYPDPDLGERTCLCVIMKPGVEVSSLDLRQFAVGKTEKCRIPDTVLKLEDFPRLANGKIDKKKLRGVVKETLGV